MKRLSRMQPFVLRGALLLGVAGIIGAGEGEINEQGLRYVAPGDPPALRKEPDAAADKLGSALPGYRVRYKKKKVRDGVATWFQLSTPGLPTGWIEAAFLLETLPVRPPAKAIAVDPRDVGIFQGTAALTSAGRGLDPRAVQFAKRYQAASPQERQTAIARATIQFRSLFWRISRIMADVPHDGETPDATGKKHPSGMMNEKKTADGRLRAGDAFKKELK